MKICPPSTSICAPESSPACVNEDLTANSKAISIDKSPSKLSMIPPAMLSSRCPFRISFRLAPVSMEPNSKGIHDTRFTEWHAGMHHDHTAHPWYSLKLDTKRVLNSSGEYYVVHRLIRSSMDGKLVEISGHCPHEDDTSSHACNCSNDPSFRIAFHNSRSEVLRNYRKELSEMENEVMRRVAEAERSLAEAERRVAELERRVAEAERGMSCKGFKESADCGKTDC